MPLRSIVLVEAEGDPTPAIESEADAVAFTLADARSNVGTLRRAAEDGLARVKASGKRALVVVNHPRTRLLRDDLDALVRPELDGVLLAHASGPQDARDLAVLLREFELGRGIEPGTVKAYPVISSARGLLRAAEIVQAVPRVAGLVFATGAYAMDIGGRDEAKGPRLAYARGAVVAAARGFDALPLVVSDDMEWLALAQYGFAGALLTDVKGVAGANAAFTPGRARLDRARGHAEAYAAARAEGAWVGRWHDEVADAHSARKAQQLLD